MHRLEQLIADGHEMRNMETGESLETVLDRVQSANAYIGAAPIVQALSKGATVVITGRSTDTALTYAPMMHAFGWSPDDYDRLAAGVEHRVPDHLVTRRDPEPVEEVGGTGRPPGAGGRPRGRGPPYADGGEVEPDQRVEGRGLARAGGATERDDGVVGGEPEPFTGALDHLGGRSEDGVVDVPAGGFVVVDVTTLR
jgi:hypothetical protein